MIVVAAHIDGVSAYIVNSTGPTNLGSSPAVIAFADLQYLYANNTGALAGVLKPVRRSDDSGTQEVFAAWIGLQDATTKQFNSNVLTNNNVIKAQGNEGIRDYISNTNGTIGFVDVAFSDNYGTAMPQGNSKVIAATMNGTQATKDNRGLTLSGTLGTYNNASKTVNGAGASGTNGLARDLYYYSYGVPTGAVKSFEDYVMSPDGQKILTNNGFFQPT